MNIPKNLFYTKDHEWIEINDKICKIGITDFAQGELGDIVFMEMPEIGNKLKTGDTAGTIEAVKTVSDLFMPVSGEVIEFNEALEDAPELINSDPYGDGWIIKVSISDASELDTLLSSDEYKNLIS